MKCKRRHFGLGTVMTCNLDLGEERRAIGRAAVISGR